MHVRYFRYLGVLLLLIPTVYLAVFGLEPLMHLETGVWLGFSVLSGVAFVLAGLDRGPYSTRTRLAVAYLLAGVGAGSNLVAVLVTGDWGGADAFAVTMGVTALCFLYFAYAIGTDNGAFEFDFEA
ncbi:hypothetical protein [Haloarchaeobius sp. DYHT-AS-18]|uniref:hypothetical protein n=1 Tax=Haloarchaeobius sp. DYHT-AS-18 TaxID=3446117 RepID=UPI003EC0C58B